MTRTLKLYIGLGLVALLVFAGVLFYRRGLHTGQRGEVIHALDTARTTLAKRVDVATAVAAKADTAAKVQVRKSADIHQRVRVARAAIVVEQLPHNVQAYIALTDEMAAQDTTTIVSLEVAAAKKDAVIIPLAAHDSLGTFEIHELKQQTSPRIGFKTGAAAGVGAVVVIVWLVSHFHAGKS